MTNPIVHVMQTDQELANLSQALDFLREQVQPKYAHNFETELMHDTVHRRMFVGFDGVANVARRVLQNVQAVRAQTAGSDQRHSWAESGQSSVLLLMELTLNRMIAVAESYVCGQWP